MHLEAGRLDASVPLKKRKERVSTTSALVHTQLGHNLPVPADQTRCGTAEHKRDGRRTMLYV
jgi:hypothetical protein